MYIKRKIVIATLCIFGSFVKGNAQDIIITTGLDTVNCKILAIENDSIYYIYQYKGVLEDKVVALSNVYEHKVLSSLKDDLSNLKKRRYSDNKHFRIALNGGLGYRTAKLSEDVPIDFEDYVNDLRTSLILEGDVTYFFVRRIGIGVNCNLSRSSNSIDNIYVEDFNGKRKYGEMEDRISTSYIGPTVVGRFLDSNNKHAFNFYITAGYLYYSNKMVRVDDYKMTSNTTGLGFGLVYDLGLTDFISLGLQLSCFSGSLNRFELEDDESIYIIELEQGVFESLTRVEISAGLRFNL